MRSVTFTFLLLAAIAVTAQTRTFRWQDELCTYDGTYNAGKVSVVQLRNTLKLARPGSYSLETNTTVWNFEDIAKIDLKSLDLEFQRKSAELKALDIAAAPYWQDFRKKKLREMEQVYKLERTTMRAYREPAALLEYRDAPTCTAKFAEPIIAGGDELLKTWLLVNEDSRSKNSDPERLKRIFDNQLRSPDKFRFALLEVMAFGWSNCANELIEYINYDGTPEREFKKLFTKTRTIRCEEP